MASIPDPRITSAEYLRRERLAEEKSEYVDGYVYAMSGASIPHNFIASNLMVVIGSALKGSPCKPLGSDMRVRTPSSHLFTYPDLVIVCGQLELHDEQNDTLLNPTIIIEILSPSTEKWDRGGKFARYQSIPSLQDYVLVSQDIPRVERFSRNGDEWTLVNSEGLEATLKLPSVKVEVNLADIYEDVEFDPLTPPRT